MAEPTLEQLAEQATRGDRDALESLCRELQHMVYRLALRFFSTPEDAEDATQEILVKVVTNLGSFEGRSKLTTWVYTIASRHLVRSRRRAIESSVQGSEAFGGWLDRNLATHDYDASGEAEYKLLCGDVRISCTYGMLLCLSRDLRIAYLLGDLLGMPDREGAEILDISPAAFRQRLARARKTMRQIISGRCGLVSETNPCRCSRQIESSLSHQILDPENLRHARSGGVTAPISTSVLVRAAEQLDHAEAIADIYRSDPEWLAPAGVWAGLQKACPDLLG